MLTQIFYLVQPSQADEDYWYERPFLLGIPVDI